MLNAVYEDDVFADGEAKGRMDLVSTFLSNGGTVESARNLLKATDAEIQFAQSRILYATPISN